MKTRLLMLLMMSSFALFMSCGDDEEKPSNFSSQAEADAIVTSLEDDGDDDGILTSVYDGALSSIDHAVDFDGTFDIGGFRKAKSLKKISKIMGRGYNAGTGWWSFDTTITEQGSTWSHLYQMRFTPRNVNGYPDNTTDKAEYKANLNGNATGFDIGFVYNMTITGLVGYKAETGNATINGYFNATTSISEEQTTIESIFKFKYNSLVVSPTATYPMQSGSMEFTLKFDMTPRPQHFDGYYIAAKITFNGTRYASMTFGGYNYTIDLDTGAITHA
jgi:hypothetical protein